MRSLSAIFVTLMLASCETIPQGRRAEEAHLAKIHQLFATAPDIRVREEVERAAFAMASRHAQRNGRGLTLNFLDGTHHVFENSPACEDLDHVSECQQFVLEAYLSSRHLFLVEKNFYEGSVYLLVDDRAGEVTEISAEPHFGPDEERFLVIDDDYAYGSGWELQIWRRVGERAEVEWRWMSGEEQTPFPPLIDLLRYEPNDIFLDMHTEADLYHPEKRWPAKLHHSPNGWELQMNLPFSRP
jgi:hypothetical protein